MGLLKKIKWCLCLGFLAGVVITVLVGCIGYDTEWNPSYTNRYGHEKSHFRVVWQDMAEVHRFVDRHLFNFDENDPDRY